MVLPLGRIIAQVVVPLIAVLARAIPAAYSQAIANARRNGVDATQTATSMLRREISKSEALQILNLTEAEATAEAVEKVRHVHRTPPLATPQEQRHHKHNTYSWPCQSGFNCVCRVSLHVPQSWAGTCRGVVL